MGGTIDVESELGKGSKFTVVLKHHLADEKYYAQVNEDLSLLNANKNIRGGGKNIFYLLRIMI